jgi:phosphatidylcholine synthase
MENGVSSHRDNATGISRVLAYSVHLYTACGLIVGMFVAAAILSEKYDLAFLWMSVAVLIDATDGSLARRFRVAEVLPHIDGRKLDDIVDYLNYTFLPLVMICHAEWLPRPAWLWTGIPLVASSMAFVNAGAKEEEEGFFLGFPSYWNIFAFYTAHCLRFWGPGLVLAAILVLSVLSVTPVRFVYPNRAPRFRAFFMLGGYAWLGLIVVYLLFLKSTPAASRWLLWLSFVYPFLYVLLSIYLDLWRRERGVNEIGGY